MKVMIEFEGIVVPTYPEDTSEFDNWAFRNGLHTYMQGGGVYSVSNGTRCIFAESGDVLVSTNTSLHLVKDGKLL